MPLITIDLVDGTVTPRGSAVLCDRSTAAGEPRHVFRGCSRIKAELRLTAARDPEVPIDAPRPARRTHADLKKTGESLLFCAPVF